MVAGLARGNGFIAAFVGGLCAGPMLRGTKARGPPCTHFLLRTRRDTIKGGQLATLSVLKFTEADGADRMISRLEELQKMQMIKIEDAAIVSWPEGQKKPRTRNLSSMTGLGAMDGAFWGLLFGLIFFVPLFGAAIGAAMGALSGSMADVGIDDDFIKQVRDRVTEGTSALFLLTSDAVIDRVKEAVEGIDFEIITTNLPKEEEDRLRETFEV